MTGDDKWAASGPWPHRALLPDLGGVYGPICETCGRHVDDSIHRLSPLGQSGGDATVAPPDRPGDFVPDEWVTETEAAPPDALEPLLIVFARLGSLLREMDARGDRFAQIPGAMAGARQRAAILARSTNLTIDAVERWLDLPVAQHEVATYSALMGLAAVTVGWLATFDIPEIEGGDK